MVLLPPPCPMAEFAIPRHSAVMERLRRRIELCRRHHSTCEARYEAVSPERLELERQHTFALHQRCLQAKAKRAGKHRQPAPPAPAPAAAPPAPAPAPAPAVEGSDSSAAEQSRTSSALIAQLHESVKRNRDSTGSPQNGEQQNGYGEMFSVHKKPRHDDTLGVSVSSNGMPPLSPLPHLDKSSGGDALQPNGKHSLGLDSINKKCLPDSNLHSNGSSNANDSFQISLNKEMKQEPVDDLPCMISGTGGSMSQNNLMPDLNLNEQEWKELIDELNRSVPDEDMKDLFNEDFEEKKDTETSSSATQTPLPQDINIKTEFSPATFEQEQLGSPQVRSTSSGQTFIGSSSVAVSTASPVIGTSQTGFQTSSQPGAENPNQTMMQAASQSQNVQRPLANVLLPGQGSGGSKEMSSAHQLQQIAAKQKRDQMLQSQQQTQQVHQPGQMANWPPSGPSHSPLAVPYSVENPTSPSVYQQDFNNQKLMMSTMTNKSSPRTGGTYLQPSHVGLLTHQPNTLNQNSVAGQGSMLDYGNTKPLSHYKADCGQVSGQNKAPMLAYLPQQLPHMNEEQNALYMLKPKPGNIPYRPLVPHSQDQNPSNVPRAPVSVPASSVGTQPPAVSMANTHGTAAYLNTQQQAAAAAAAAMKQHQLLLDQQKQREQQQKQLQQQQQQHFLIGQRQQQLLAEQEKQRQEQQFQRHLTRPPPQYQEQNQTTYQQVGQFTGSSAAMAGVSSLGPSNSGSPRMFPQMQIGPGHGSVSSIPSNPSQQDRSVAQYSGTQSLQRGSLYSVAPGMAPMVPQHAPQASNGHAHMPRQPSVGQSSAVSAGYGQNALGNAGLPPQHSKGALNPTLSKPSLPRVPAAVGPQNPSWQHQGVPSMNSQPQAGSGGGPFPATSTFHMQQPHLKMPSQQFPQGGPQVNLGTSRPMTSINSSVSGPMMSSMSTQQRTNTSAQPQVPAQQVLPGMSSAVPDLTAFSQNPSQQLANRASMHCGQGYQVRTANQELPFTYSAPPGNSGLQSITGDTDLIDSLLKNRTSEEWINDLDELLGTH